MKKSIHFVCSKCFGNYVEDREIELNNGFIIDSLITPCSCLKCQTSENIFVCDSNISANIIKLNKKHFYTSECCEGHYIAPNINPYILFKPGININVIDYSEYVYWRPFLVDKEKNVWILKVVNMDRYCELNKGYDKNLYDEKQWDSIYFKFDDFNKHEFESFKHQWLKELNKIVNDLCNYRKSLDPLKYKRPKLNKEKIKENKKIMNRELKEKGIYKKKKKK